MGGGEGETIEEDGEGETIEEGGDRPERPEETGEEDRERPAFDRTKVEALGRLFDGKPRNNFSKIRKKVKGLMEDEEADYGRKGRNALRKMKKMSKRNYSERMRNKMKNLHDRHIATLLN